MKVAICIMSTMFQPSIRNNKAFKDTVVKYCNEQQDELKHQYEFFFYYSNTEDNSVIKDNDYPNVYHLYFDEHESVYRTFEKTRCCLKWIKDNHSPDVYVRTNISTYININLLDSVIEHIDKDKVYCNRINNHTNPTSAFFNDVYPRGDFMVFGESVVNAIDICGISYVSGGEKYDSIGVDHVDDCLIGVCMKDYYGAEYYSRLQCLKYNFVPDVEIDYTQLFEYSIATRLKTCPPGACSGYSWNDNEYRLYDVNKFHFVHDKLSNITYGDVLIDDVCTYNVYQICTIESHNITTEQYKKYKSGC